MTSALDRRRLYGTATFLGVSCAVFVVAGQGALSRSREIDTQRIVLRDATGQIRAELIADENGGTKIALLDSNGRERLALKSTNDDDAALELYDNGRVQVSIASDTQGRSAIRLFDANNKSRATLYVSPDSTSGLELYSDGHHIAAAAQPDGMSGVVVTDGQTDVEHRLGILPDDLRVQRGEAGSRPFQASGSHPAPVQSVAAAARPVGRQPAGAAPARAN